MSVVWSDPALRDLRRVDPETRMWIIDVVDRFAATGHGDVRPLTGGPGWRLRVADWRVLFDLDNAAGVFLATDVRPRGRASR